MSVLNALVNYTRSAYAHRRPGNFCHTASSPAPQSPASVSGLPTSTSSGKDIVKFHAVYWPAMPRRWAALPKQILVHGWWQRMAARSQRAPANVVDPICGHQRMGRGCLALLCSARMDIGPDGTGRMPASAHVISGTRQRSGKFGNRSLSMLKRYRNGIVPVRSNELAADAAKAADETRALFKQSQLQAALQKHLGPGEPREQVRG